MMTTIQFDVQFCRFTEEIQGVDAQRMLAAEFIAVELPATQLTPHEFFSPGVVFPKSAGVLGCHAVNLGKGKKTES